MQVTLERDNWCEWYICLVDFGQLTQDCLVTCSSVAPALVVIVLMLAII